MSDNDHRSPEYNIYGYDKAGNQLFLQSAGGKHSLLNDDFWFLCENSFQNPSGLDHIMVEVKVGKINKREFFAIDNLVIYPQHSIHYMKFKKGWILNNVHQ